MANKHEHVVLLLPGLSGRTYWLDLLSIAWPKLGLDRVIYPINWYDAESYSAKEQELADEVNSLRDIYQKISVVGASAGGVVAFNLKAILNEQIYKAVDNCGRLRPGTEKGFRSFARRSTTSPKFVQAVNQFTEREKHLTSSQLRHMMTIRPAWGDELVPADTCYLDGAVNKQIRLIEHEATIAYAMLSGAITSFLLK